MQIEIVVAIQKRARDVGSRPETTPITRPFWGRRLGRLEGRGKRFRNKGEGRTQGSDVVV